MVSVENTTELLVHDTELALSRRLEKVPTPDLIRVFSHWLLDRPESAEITAILANAIRQDGAQQDYRAVAILSYGLASGLLGGEQSDDVRNELGWLIGRSPYVDDIPMAFCSDCVAILGWTVAVRSLQDPSLRSTFVAWLRSFVPKIYAMEGTEDWQRCLLWAADTMLERSLGLPDAVPTRSPESFLALAKRRVFDLAALDAEALRLSVIRSALLVHPAEMPLERVVILAAALEDVKESAPVALPGRMSAQSLIELIQRFPAGLRNWTWEARARTSASQARQWHVDHEYHVQNMLWFLLSPIFPDLDDEQYLTKIGQKNPRADLYIPSMRLMIEAKFVRKGKPFQSIIDEISSDASLYSAMGNAFEGLIVFVWDDSGRIQEHDYLKNGLRKLSGVLGTIVVSRPADWTTGPVAEGSTIVPTASSNVTA